MNAFFTIGFILIFFLILLFMRRVWIQRVLDQKEAERRRHCIAMGVNPDNQLGNHISVIVDVHSDMPTRPLASHTHIRSTDQLPLYEAAPPDYNSLYNKGAAPPPQEHGVTGASEAWQNVHLGAPAPASVASDHPALVNNGSTTNLHATPWEAQGAQNPGAWSRLRGA